jgi:hypothetical protein
MRALSEMARRAGEAGEPERQRVLADYWRENATATMIRRAGKWLAWTGREDGVKVPEPWPELDGGGAKTNNGRAKS